MDTPEKGWKKTRKMGRLRYGLLYGFSFAVVYAVIFAGWEWIKTRQAGTIYPYKDLLLSALLCFILASVMYGTFVWWLNEKYYNENDQEEDQP